MTSPPMTEPTPSLDGKDVLVFPALVAQGVFSHEVIDSIREFIERGGSFILAGSENDYDEFFVDFLFPVVIAPGDAEWRHDPDQDRCRRGDHLCRRQGPCRNQQRNLLPTHIVSAGERAQPLCVRRPISAVTVVPGQGHRSFSSRWDWYDAKPNFDENGGWLDLLASAVSRTDRAQSGHQHRRNPRRRLAPRRPGGHLQSRRQDSRPRRR